MVLLQHPHGYYGSTTPWGFASATGMGKECRGSRVAPYSATSETNEPYSLNLTSISAMAQYNDRTHEELRLEDYELCKVFPGTTSQNGFSFPIQNQGNEFQLSSSIFGHGPASVPLPPSQSSFGFRCGFASDQSNSFFSSTPASSSESSFGYLGRSNDFQQSNSLLGPRPAYVPSSQSPFGTHGGPGTNPFRFPSASPFGPEPTSVLSSHSPFASLSGPGTNPFRFPSASPFGPEPASVPSSQSPFASLGGPGTNPFRFPSGSPFGPEPASVPSSQSPFASLGGPGTNPFRFPSASPFGPEPASVPSSQSSFASLGGPETNLFRFPSGSVPGFGITSTPFSWPTSQSVSNTVAPGISNNHVSTTSGCSFSSTPAFGIQASSGSLSTTAAKYKGSRAPSYFPTKEVEDNMESAVILSISAMPSHKDKSHEELRFEDYELGNTGGQKLRNFSASFAEAYNTPNQSSVHSPFSLFKSNSSEPNTENFITPSNTISSAPTISPSVNPFCCTNVFPSQSQAFTLQPATASFMPTFSPNLNQPSLIPFTEPVIKKRCECSQIPTKSTSATTGAFSLATTSVIVSPSIQCTSPTASDPWPFTVTASQPQQTVENVVSLSTDGLNKPSQASSGLTTVEFTSQNIKGQQYVPSSTLNVESSLVGNPFPTQFPVDQPNAVTSRQHGISSLPVSNNLSSNRSTSLLRIRHVSSRLHGSPTQKTNDRSSVTKVPFFINEEDRPLPAAPFMPRENPRIWVNISFPLCEREDSKGDEVKDNSSVFQLGEDMSAVRLNQHDVPAATARSEKRVADVVALLPKLPDGDYYTEPSLHELAAKEIAEAGCCSQVKDFVVGRKSYGSIKFLGETDVRHLDIKSLVQFNEREIIVYPDERKKPEAGQQLNKAAEVSILNVKCINRKTGEQYVEGHQVDRYQEMLMNKTLEQGAEFVSYDPVEGEWKFRVEHF